MRVASGNAGAEAIGSSRLANTALRTLVVPELKLSNLVFLDAIDPKPPAGSFPAELNLNYKVTPVFRATPNSFDPPRTFALHLPITTPPSQIPKLASVGLAQSAYSRDADYTTTDARTKMLWFEFDQPVQDPHDLYFPTTRSTPVPTNRSKPLPPAHPSRAIDFGECCRTANSSSSASISACLTAGSAMCPSYFCQRDVQPRVSHNFPKQVKVDRSAASFRDVEPVSCEFEPSLLDQNMDIENSRPETDARNQPDGARNRDKIALGD
jgi:hypothetical protein